MKQAGRIAYAAYLIVQIVPRYTAGIHTDDLTAFRDDHPTAQRLVNHLAFAAFKEVEHGSGMIRDERGGDRHFTLTRPLPLAAVLIRRDPVLTTLSPQALSRPSR